MSLRFALTALAMCAAQPLLAQVSTHDGINARLGGRIQPQYNSTSVGTEPQNQMLVRRAFITIDASRGWLSGRVEADVGEGRLNPKDLFISANFSDALHVRVGQFKRPFDIFELTSDTRILVVERAGSIRGVSACSGVGGVCTLSRLTEKLGYSDRDIGVEVSGQGGQLSWSAAMTNGSGANVEDVNGAKSFTGRLSATVGPHLQISANAGAHDYIHPVGGSDEYAVAFGGDLQYGDLDHGLVLQAGIVRGDNWAVPVGTTDAAKFMTAQAILAYAVPVQNDKLVGVQPLLRVSYADPNTSVTGDHGMLFTPGINLLFGHRNRLAINLDLWKPNTGTSETSVKVQQFFYF